MYWLRRSKYGYESDTVPGLKFESAEQAQNALVLIWKGIVFSQKVSTGKTLKTRTETACSDGFCGEGEVPDIVEKKIEYKIIIPNDDPLLIKIIRVLDGGKEGFWYSYNGREGKVYPLIIDKSRTDEGKIKSNKNSKYSSQDILEAKDEYGIERKINDDFYMNKKLSLLFYPEIKKEKDCTSICFGEENIGVAQFCEKHMDVYFSFFLENEEIKDKYSTFLYFDDRRIV